LDLVLISNEDRERFGLDKDTVSLQIFELGNLEIVALGNLLSSKLFEKIDTILDKGVNGGDSVETFWNEILHPFIRQSNEVCISDKHCLAPSSIAEEVDNKYYVDWKRGTCQLLKRINTTKIHNKLDVTIVSGWNLQHGSRNICPSDYQCLLKKMLADLGCGCIKRIKLFVVDGFHYNRDHERRILFLYKPRPPLGYIELSDSMNAFKITPDGNFSRHFMFSYFGTIEEARRQEKFLENAKSVAKICLLGEYLPNDQEWKISAPCEIH